MFSLGLCQCCLYPPPSGLQVVAARGRHERGQRAHQERHRHWGNSDPGLYELWLWHKARVGIRRAALGSAQLLLTWPHRSLSMAAQAFFAQKPFHGCCTVGPLGEKHAALASSSLSSLHLHRCFLSARLSCTASASVYLHSVSLISACLALHLSLCISASLISLSCTAPAFYISHLSVLHCICHLCICISATLHLASQSVLHLVLHGQSMAQHSVHVLFGLAWVGAASWACS